jgi:hypothetical protein
MGTTTFFFFLSWIELTIVSSVVRGRGLLSMLRTNVPLLMNGYGFGTFLNVCYRTFQLFILKDLKGLMMSWNLLEKS